MDALGPLQVYVPGEDDVTFPVGEEAQEVGWRLVQGLPVTLGPCHPWKKCRPAALHLNEGSSDLPGEIGLKGKRGRMWGRVNQGLGLSCGASGVRLCLEHPKPEPLSLSISERGAEQGRRPVLGMTWSWEVSCEDPRNTWGSFKGCSEQLRRPAPHSSR